MKDVLIYNSLGEQLTRLAQWDRDVYVSIEDAGITTNYPVRFFNKNSDRAYAVESTYDGGKLKAKIPDHLLREPYTICGYVQLNDGDDERRSDFRFIIGVVPMPQPTDYIMRTDPDYIEVESLKEEYKQLQKQADQALADAQAANQTASSLLEETKQAIKDANTAKDNANTAADAANTAKTQADAARDRANEAAEGAETAKDDTVKATAGANTAANRATSATDAANKAAADAGQAADAAKALTDEAVQALKDAQAVISEAKDIAFFIDENDFGLNARILKEGF